MTDDLSLESLCVGAETLQKLFCRARDENVALVRVLESKDVHGRPISSCSFQIVAVYHDYALISTLDEGPPTDRFGKETSGGKSYVLPYYGSYMLCLK